MPVLNKFQELLEEKSGHTGVIVSVIAEADELATAQIQFADNTPREVQDDVLSLRAESAVEIASIEAGDTQLKQRARNIRDMRTAPTAAWSIAVQNAVRQQVANAADVLDGGSTEDDIDIVAARTAIYEQVAGATGNVQVDTYWKHRVDAIRVLIDDKDILAALLMSMISGTEAGLSRSLED